MRNKKLLYLALLVSPFLLNDFPLIYAKTYIQWILIDYAVRILIIAAIIYLVKKKNVSLSEFGLVRINLKQFFKWSLILSFVGIVIDQVGWRFFDSILPKTKLMSYPTTGNALLNAIDLTFGLCLVSISEELVFRGYFYTVARNYTKKFFIITAFSSVVFGAIHWSLGLHAVIVSAIWGVLPMIALLKTGSVIPALFAHYATDFVSFSHIIPDNWSKFITIIFTTILN